MLDAPPQTIGRFEILRLVGQGAMGRVFAARDPMLDRPVAVKVAHPCAGCDPVNQERLIREARIAARLRHDNLAEILEVGHFQQGVYLVSRWAGGGSLRQWLDERAGPLSEGEAIDLMIQITDGLAHCHRNQVTHLDIKPANILFDDSTDGATGRRPPPPGRAMVSDFGVSRISDATATLTSGGSLVGTPMYMAPEQVEQRDRAIGPPTDIYACGLLMMELIGGRHPLADRPLAEVLWRTMEGALPQWPAGCVASRPLRDVVRRCLMYAPAARYADAGQLHDDLQRIRDGEPIATRPRRPLHQLHRLLCQRRHLDVAAAITLATNGVIVFGLLSIWLALVMRWTDQSIASTNSLIADIMTVTAILHGPMMVMSILIIRRRTRLHPINTAFSFIFLAVLVGCLLSGQGPVGMYEGQPFAFFLMYWTLFNIASIMTLANCLTLPAWWRHGRG